MKGRESEKGKIDSGFRLVFQGSESTKGAPFRLRVSVKVSSGRKGDSVSNSEPKSGNFEFAPCATDALGYSDSNIDDSFSYHEGRSGLRHSVLPHKKLHLCIRKKIVVSLQLSLRALSSNCSRSKHLYFPINVVVSISSRFLLQL